MKKKRHPGKIELVRRWFDKWAAVKILLAVGYIFLLLKAWIFLTEDPDTDYFLLILLSLMSGIAICYFSAAGLLNRTKIVIAGEAVKIKNYPLPFPGDRTFISSDIIEYHIRSTLDRNQICQKIKFEIHALTDYGRQFKVLNGIACMDQAELIRSELARHTLATDRL